MMTDILVKEFLLEEISSRLGEPILLNKTDFLLIAICRSSRTAHSSVIFLPPEGHYFAAAGIKYPGIFKGVDEYTRENLVPSDLIYKSFIAWMREVGIRKDFVPSDLFFPYASWGAMESQVIPQWGREPGHSNGTRSCLVHLWAMSGWNLLLIILMNSRSNLEKKRLY